MRQRIRSPHRDDPQRPVAPNHPLQNVMDRPISPGSQDRIASRLDGMSGLGSGFPIRFGGSNLHLYSPLYQDFSHRQHLSETPLLTWPRKRVVENDRLVHEA